MAIRFRKYRNTKDKGTIVNAVKLTANNVAEVVAYVNKNGGFARDESVVFVSDDLREGKYLSVKVAVKQRVFVGGKTRKDIRKAFRGDLIARNELETPVNGQKYEFWRIRDAGIDGYVPA